MWNASAGGGGGGAAGGAAGRDAPSLLSGALPNAPSPPPLPPQPPPAAVPAVLVAAAVAKPATAPLVVGRECTPFDEDDGSVTACHTWCAPSAKARHCVMCSCESCGFCAKVATAHLVAAKATVVAPPKVLAGGGGFSGGDTSVASLAPLAATVESAPAAEVASAEVASAGLSAAEAHPKRKKVDCSEIISKRKPLPNADGFKHCVDFQDDDLIACADHYRPLRYNDGSEGLLLCEFKINEEDGSYSCKAQQHSIVC